MSGIASASSRRVRAGICLVLGYLLLAGCGGGNDDNDTNASLGTSDGVSITSSTGSSSLYVGETLDLTATVGSDPTKAGVTWTLTGQGSLTNVTTTTATYVAPTAVTGAITPVISAVANANSSYTASAVLSVSGSPVIDPVQMFPGYVSSEYAAAITVSGGKSSYTWELTSGSLPDGLSLAGNTIYYETISGTPTTTGTYNFQLRVTDANGQTATADLTLTINPAAACVLNGQFALLATGLTGGALSTRAGSITVASDGTVTGVVDRKNGGSTTVNESLSGTCDHRTGNNGELLLTGSTDSPNLNFAVTTALTQGRLQLTNGGSDATASGLFVQQDPSAFNLATLAGDFAIGLQGVDASNARHGVIGTLSVNSAGIVTAGRTDSNSSNPLDAAALTGTMSAPDSRGRGTLSISGGGQSFNLAYYVVNANRLLVVNADSAASAPRLAGFMTRRAASFSNSSLAAPGVLSLWGAVNSTTPSTVMSLGRLSNGNATAGTIDLLLDVADRDKTSAGNSIPGATYSVESDGRATLSYTASGITHSFNLYLDATANGYVIERGSSNGAAGLLEAQSAAPFSNSMSGMFVLGTQFPQGLGPVILLPANYLSGGTLSATNASGYLAIDETTGRGIGYHTVSGVSGDDIALYVVNPSKLVMLRNGTANQNAAIEWIIAN